VSKAGLFSFELVHVALSISVATLKCKGLISSR
jgi:hypothetical protein